MVNHENHWRKLSDEWRSTASVKYSFWVQPKQSRLWLEEEEEWKRHSLLIRRISIDSSHPSNSSRTCTVSMHNLQWNWTVLLARVGRQGIDWSKSRRSLSSWTHGNRRWMYGGRRFARCQWKSYSQNHCSTLKVKTCLIFLASPPKRYSLDGQKRDQPSIRLSELFNWGGLSNL